MRFINLYRTSQAWRYGANFKDFTDLKVEDGADLLFSQTSQQKIADSNNSVQQDVINDSQIQIIHNAASSKRK